MNDLNENNMTDNKIENDEAMLEMYGAQIAKIFLLRRDEEHRERFETRWGSKSEIGIARTILRMAESMKEKKEL